MTPRGMGGRLAGGSPQALTWALGLRHVGKARPGCRVTWGQSTGGSLAFWWRLTSSLSASPPGSTALPAQQGPASCSAVAAQARRRFPPQPPSARVCLLALPGGRVTALVQRSLASRAARYQVPLIRRDLRQTTLCSPSSLRLCLSPSPPLPPPSPPPGYVTPVEDCTHRHASTRSRA